MKRTNKILSMLLALSVFTFFAACSEDEDVKTSATKADMVGTWTLKSSDLDISVGGKSFKEVYMEATGASEEEAAIALKLFEEEGGDFEEGTLIEFQSDNKFLVKSPDDNDYEPGGNWELSADGKKITIGDAGEALIFDIISISGNSLSLTTKMTENIDLSGNGSSGMDFDINIILGLQK